MDNFKIFLIFLWTGFFIFLTVQIFSFFKYKKLLKKLKKTPLPEKYKKHILNLPEYQKLTPQQKKIIEYKIQRFLKEKEFIGIKLKITDEIKTVIAFYACLITLAYEDFCYPDLKYIYVYPHTIVLNTHQNGAVISNEEILISGEALKDGVIIAWDEVKKDIKLKRNVVIHEFAHILDFEEGEINGIPPIEESKYTEWSKIMFKEYEKFREKLLKNRLLGKYSLIDKYAATNKAEFFAVLSEYYFKKPEILKKHFPKIYKELKSFYKIELGA